MGAAGLDHAGEESIDCTMVDIEESPTLRGNLVQLLRTLAGADRHITKLPNSGQAGTAPRWRLLEAGDPAWISSPGPAWLGEG